MNKSIKDQLEEMWCTIPEESFNPDNERFNSAPIRNTYFDDVKQLDTDPSKFSPRSWVESGCDTGISRDERFLINKMNSEYLDKLESELGRKVIEVLKENYCE